MTRAGRFALSGAALILFSVALGFAVTSGWSAGIDRFVAQATGLTRASAWSGMIPLWQGISWIGGGIQRYGIVLVCAILLGIWHRPRSGLALILASITAQLISEGLKIFFGRLRPEFVPHLDHTSNLAFPSGHATSAAVVYLLFAMTAPTQRRGLWLAGAAIMALLTGVSRLALGVHWLTDLIGGWALGSGVALLTLAWLMRRDTRVQPA